MRNAEKKKGKMDMNGERLTENITEQIKEAQLKLGYAREMIRLFFPVESLCSLLNMPLVSGAELLAAIQKEDRWKNTVLGELRFSLHKDRMEVCVAPEGAAYVYEQVPDPPFLVRIIKLFQDNHSLTIEEICACFEQFSKQYICEKMEPGTDFDYVLYFTDKKPDAWYYCVRMEMGHTIYHRFTEEDYRSLTGRE